MKKHILPVLLAGTLLTTACAPSIKETLDGFAAGINANSASQVSRLISREATDYPALSNNDWSGLKQALENWRNEGAYSFSALDERENGDQADVTCTVEKTLTGSRPGYFKMVKESSFLSRPWKIKQWKIDADSDGFGNDDIRIQRPD